MCSTHDKITYQAQKVSQLKEVDEQIDEYDVIGVVLFETICRFLGKISFLDKFEG